MSTTLAPSKRTTKRTTIDPLAPLAGEDPTTYIERMIALDTAEADAAAEAYLATSDAAAERDAFRAQVTRYLNVGTLLVHHATRVKGSAPTTFSECSEAVNVKADNAETFAGKRYSTLRETYRVSTLHDADEVDRFVSVWHEVYGAAPRNVRDLLTWLERVADPEDSWMTLNTVEAYAKQRDERLSAAKSAAETTKQQRKQQRKLAEWGYVPELASDIPQSRWATFTVEELTDIALLAQVLAAKLAAKQSDATVTAVTEAAAREALAETGPADAPKPQRKRTVKS